MKLREKLPVRGNIVILRWEMDDIKTEEACFALAAAAADIGELIRIECEGYSDMDTHENYCSFETKKAFEKGLDKVRKIDADTISVFLNVGGTQVTVDVNPVWNNDAGTNLSVMGPEEAAEKVSSAIRKKLG